MASTTSIVLSDEGTRRALLYAVWERVCSEYPDGTSFDQAFYEEARGSLSRNGMEDRLEVYEAEAEIGVLQMTLRDVERIQTAACGTVIELEIPRDKLLHELAQCAAYIQEHEEFWIAPAAERDRMLATFDATQRLLAESEAAEAVA